MVHGLFRASGIVMIYRLHHVLSEKGAVVFWGDLFLPEIGGEISANGGGPSEPRAIFADAGTLESPFWGALFTSPAAGKLTLSSECLGHFWRAEVGQFWKAPKPL
jgi:hypothetical protein